ncbi:MAG TPA: DUF5689 domain-containing protein [Bacteroidales bacterium]|nr:DUF5689 domain-containing protein [Bacteroidales bacterium]HPS16166.1 DUF5689 domain-containing protein [Bacteroidales bacterium]
MNKFNKIYKSFFIIAMLTIFSSCVKKDFDDVPLTVPSVDFTSNCTIANLKQYYADNNNGVPLLISNDTIIEGVVTANDESGNLYKKLFIQDGTAGLEIELDKADTYTEFRIGQKVFIKCKGLYIGEYGSKVQLGYISNGEMGRIPLAYISEHIFLDGMPGTAPAAEHKSIASFTSADYDKLITMDSVYFETPGVVYAITGDENITATERKIVDKSGTSSIALRTSSYANFAGYKTPKGYGSVTGILGIYNGTYQFYIRDTNDVKGFAGNSPVYLVNENFSTGTLNTFTEYSVIGDGQHWTASSFSGTYFAKISGYSSGYFANEDWLISPSVNFDNYTSEILNFFTMMNYGSAGDGSLKVYYSTDYVSGNPNLATWIDITSSCSLSTGSWTNVSSGDVDVSAITGTNVHLAFKYTCSTSNVATWELGGITIKGLTN